MILGPGWADGTAEAGDTPLQRAIVIAPGIKLPCPDRGNRDPQAYASLTDSLAEEFAFRRMDEGMRSENFCQRRQGPARSEQNRCAHDAIATLVQFSNNLRDRGGSQLTGRFRAVRQMFFLIRRFELSCEMIRLDGPVLLRVRDHNAPAIQ